MNKPETKPCGGGLTGVSGRYWRRLADSRIQCDLRPRYCKLHDGQRGLCFVRARQGDEVLLTTYGRSSGFCVDPIEKKPLNHFLPGTPVLSFGTAGCNLTCKFCQNWDISKARNFDRLQSEAAPEEIAEAAQATGSRSIAYTYNDPVIFLEYAVDVAKAARRRGIKNVAVTAGYISQKAREEFFSVMDAANIDLKAFTEGFYRTLCSAELGPVLDTLEYVKHETDVWLEITTLLIPGQNDSPTEIAALSEWIVERLGPDVPLHFSAFHSDWKMRDVPATPAATLLRARQIARSAGLRHVYSGNIHDEAGQSTYCHACGARVIGRDWYEITSWALDDYGRCGGCGAQCAGVFETSHGLWGARRAPIEIG
jgi:pyruvate formate lyase activating enzyme